MSSKTYDECKRILVKIAKINDAWSDVIEMMNKYENTEGAVARLSIDAGGKHFTLTLSASQTRRCIGSVNEGYEKEIDRLKDKLDQEICSLSLKEDEVAPVQQK